MREGRQTYELFVYSSEKDAEGYLVLGGKLRRYHGDPETKACYIRILGAPAAWLSEDTNEAA